MPVKSIPDGYSTVTPYLIVRDGARALDFYKRAFGATELYRLAAPDGKVLHAEMQVGNSRIMMAEEIPQMGARSPQALGGTPVTILLYGEGVDARVQQATAAGAKVVRPLQDQFYGDRSATLEDPFGHVWTIATHIEDVPPTEIQKRAEAMMKQRKGG
jgi:PhnB protein